MRGRVDRAAQPPDAERLGAAQALALVIGAQLSTALVIDVLRGTIMIGPRPIVGLVLIVAGAVVLRAA